MFNPRQNSKSVQGYLDFFGQTCKFPEFSKLLSISTSSTITCRLCTLTRMATSSRGQSECQTFSPFLVLGFPETFLTLSCCCCCYWSPQRSGIPTLAIRIPSKLQSNNRSSHLSSPSPPFSHILTLDNISH